MVGISCPRLLDACARERHRVGEELLAGAALAFEQDDPIPFSDAES